jgi:integrase
MPVKVIVADHAGCLTPFYERKLNTNYFSESDRRIRYVPGFAGFTHSLPAIGKVRWHDLRRTFGSLKIDQGENIYYVVRQMGHSSIQVTIDIYGHHLESRNPQAAAKTDAMRAFHIIFRLLAWC